MTTDLSDQATLAPSRVRRLVAHPLAAPVVVGVAALGVLAVVAARNPNVAGSYPICPFHAMTGLDCPGCGATRGLYELVNGNVIGVADSNLLLAVALPFLVWRYLRWTAVRAGRAQPIARLAPPFVLIAVVVLVVAFWIVRNIPGVQFLPAGVG
jgi:hypothetical protein